VRLASDLLDAYAPVLSAIELRTSSGGRFEVSLDGEVLFSKAALKRQPNPGEVQGLLIPKLGPPLDWRAP
jgi:predicted Rdx family selenoprotein